VVLNNVPGRSIPQKTRERVHEAARKFNYQLSLRRLPHHGHEWHRRPPPEFTVQLERDISSPELGYPVVRSLLQGGRHFTAIVSFNDMAAIGAIRALSDANLRVPEDVSVVGFDDIQLAAYHNPRLTTVRQPLREMVATAARILL
jgi:DNA-binding LacI/PurR family transcriptional regulator